MRRSVTAAALLTVLVAPASPAQAKEASPVVYRNTVASTLNPTITPSKCTSLRIAVNYSDPDRRLGVAGSRVEATGLVVTTTAPTWQHGISTAHHTLRLCGIATPYRETPTGVHQVTVLTGGRRSARFGFTLRYQAKVLFNATPEPVRRGAYVTLRASVTDGWEYFDTSPVRFYFRAAGAVAWRYLGAATPRCDVTPCDEGEVAYTATRRYRQSVPGTWKAVSQRTSYLESGSAADAVKI